MPFVHANGVKTFYEVTGDGPPLLLIAGNGMDHTTFRDQLSLFQKGFRCITYDMRGIGQSDIPSDGYTIATMAEDALDLLAKLGFHSAHVGGYSLGGAIGQEMALLQPERVRSLSLYSTYSHVEPYLRRRYELLIKILMEAGPDMWALFTAFTAYGEEYINGHDVELGQEIELRRSRWFKPGAPSKIGLRGHYEAILSHNSRARLPDITCPTWIAVGSSDPVTPPSYSRLMHSLIAGSELQIYPGAPHRLMNFTKAFTPDAYAFLEKVRNL